MVGALRVKAVEGLIAILSQDDQRHLYRRLEDWRNRMDWLERDLGTALETLRERRFAGGVFCPDCGSVEVWKWGKRNGKQRYRCKADGCGRVFNDFSETPFAHTRKPWGSWAQYVECMLEGKTLRECAAEVDITLRTAFRWRHVIMEALRQMDEDTQHEGLVEADETYFRYSETGDKNLTRPPWQRGGKAPVSGKSHHHVCVLTTQDRTGNRYAEVIDRGNPKHKHIFQGLAPRISDRVTGLCSDGEAAYEKFCQQRGIPHHRCESRRGGAPGEPGLQHVNNFHSLLKTWVRPFRGVASKYLDRYTSWFIFDREADAEYSRGGAWQELLTRTALADP